MIKPESNTFDSNLFQTTVFNKNNLVASLLTPQFFVFHLLYHVTRQLIKNYYLRYSTIYTILVSGSLVYSVYFPDILYICNCIEAMESSRFLEMSITEKR